MLAERLGRTRAELRAGMSHTEWVDWVALEQIRAEDRALAETKARAKAKTSKGGR